MSAFRRIAREMGVGRSLLKYYHQPIGLIRQSILEGGPWEQRRTEAARRRMEKAAAALPALAPGTSTFEVEVCYLSGARYWYQTLFCFYSLQNVLRRTITPIIYDDGTLTSEVVSVLRQCVPWARFVSSTEIRVRLDDVLPARRFPTLRARRLEYPHLRKLTDIHAGKSGWRLVMDSDVLFFRYPEALSTWLTTPVGPCYMQDVKRSYGYSDELMRSLARGDIPDAVNVGLCGLESSLIDWERLEHQCRAMIDREGAQYLQEQALTALLLTNKSAMVLPRRDYIVLPTLSEGRNPTAVMHHYVGHSKRSYFQYGWQRIVGNCGSDSPSRISPSLDHQNGRQDGLTRMLSS